MSTLSWKHITSTLAQDQVLLLPSPLDLLLRTQQAAGLQPAPNSPCTLTTTQPCLRGDTQRESWQMVAEIPCYLPNILSLGSALPRPPTNSQHSSREPVKGSSLYLLLQPLPALGTDTNEQRIARRGSGHAEE